MTETVASFFRHNYKLRLVSICQSTLEIMECKHALSPAKEISIAGVELNMCVFFLLSFYIAALPPSYAVGSATKETF